LAAISAEGSTVWVLIRRLNSSWSRSIALVVRALFHWLTGNRVKVNSRSPASSRLSATAVPLSRHLRMTARLLERYDVQIQTLRGRTRDLPHTQDIRESSPTCSSGAHTI